MKVNDLVYLIVDDYEETHGLLRDKQGTIQEINWETDRAVVDFKPIVVELPMTDIKISSENQLVEPLVWEPSEGSTSSTGSLRYNNGKDPMHLVPVSAIRAMAKVLDYGTKKYDARNWEKGNDYSVPYSSLMRHLMSFWDGEDIDPESGLPHTYHILMNAAMLVEYSEKFDNLDDRPGKGS